MMQWVVLATLAFVVVAQAVPATLVHQDNNGKLTYQHDKDGNRVMDYSSCGYKAGQPIPAPNSIPVLRTVHPSGGDDSAAIQNALNAAASAPLNHDGFRGAVLLAPGTFHLRQEIKMTASGVILRGSGTSTVIESSLGNGIILTGTGRMEVDRTQHRFVRRYIPFGTSSFELETVNGLSVGDSVVVESTITAKFIAYLGMDKLVRDGKKETWIRAGEKVLTDRKIVRIEGKNVTLDAAYPDSIRPEFFDSDADTPTIAKYTWNSRIRQSGIELLKAVHPNNENGDGFIIVDSAENCWVRNVTLQDFQGGVVTTGPGAKFVTIQSLSIDFTKNYDRPAPPQILSMKGTQILHFGTVVKGDMNNWPLSAADPTSRGPIVHHNIVINSGTKSQVVPHMRWSTAFLYDNVRNDQGTIGIFYRGIMGSGHGWTMSWGVLWNCIAREFGVQNPFDHFDSGKHSLYHNWLVGGQGQNVPGYESNKLIGTYDAPGTMVTRPSSLYLAQRAAAGLPAL